MKARAHMSLSIAIFVILGACGVPAEPATSPTTSITAPLAEPEEPGMEMVSVTACKQADPWTMVETAFEGTVTAIDPEAPGALGDTLQMVTFYVTRWYTNDYGTTFSIWAPNFAGAVGETWLIAGALYATLGQQSGEVFPCVSTPSSDAALDDWANRLGSPVPAGSGVPEGEADPAVIAQIEEQRAKWLAAGIDDYTAVISTYQRGDGYSDGCGAPGAQLRVTVVDGVATQAVDVMRFCAVDDLSMILLIDDLFDLTRANAGAITDPIDFDSELGFVRSFYASDRSVDTGAYVEMFQPLVIDPVVGTEESLQTAEEALATWEAAGIEDYSFQLDVICYCTISGRFQVTVENGEAVEVTTESGPVDLAAPDRFMDYEIEGLFNLLSDWGGEQAPDAVLASFDPETGYPIEVRIDSIRNAIDDELTYFVSEFTAD
jgi:hypothetical protein